MEDLRALQRATSRLGRHRHEAKRARAKTLPPLLAFTDPDRSGDLFALAARLPRGAAIVYRSFGAPDAQVTAWRLRRISWRRGVKLLIGADDALARRVNADGVHLPERLAARIPALRARRWLVTTAAHTPKAAQRALRLGANGVVMSPVLPSNSPSARAPIGVLRLAATVRRLRAPIYALGGVKGSNAARVAATGVVGLAAVEAFAAGPRT